jgi:hypothetical protein
MGVAGTCVAGTGIGRRLVLYEMYLEERLLDAYDERAKLGVPPGVEVGG